MTSINRPQTDDILESPGIVAVNALARNIHVERFKRREFLPVHCGNSNTSLELWIEDVALDRTVDIKVAVPAGVLAQDKAGDLLYRCVRPLGLKVDRHVSQIRRAMQRAFDPQDAGVGEAEIEISAHGLRFKAEAPLIGVGQPHSEVCVKKREGFFLMNDLEIDAGVVGLDIWESRRPAGAPLRGGSIRNVRGLQQNGTDIPASLVVADQVE